MGPEAGPGGQEARGLCTTRVREGQASRNSFQETSRALPPDSPESNNEIYQLRRAGAEVQRPGHGTQVHRGEFERPRPCGGAQLADRRESPLRERLGEAGSEQTENLRGGHSQRSQCWQEKNTTKPSQGGHWALRPRRRTDASVPSEGDPGL